MKTPVRQLNRFYLNRQIIVLESGKTLTKMWRSEIDENSPIVRDGIQYVGEMRT